MTQKPLPLYLKIKTLLLRDIAAGKWLKGERLPTESELAKQLTVAVGTLRKALAALEQEGVLERRQGSGTYVADSSEGQTVYHFFRLEKVNGAPSVPSADVVSVALKTDIEAAEALLLANDQFWCIRRVRYLDGDRAALEEILLPQNRAEHLEREGLHESLYWYYRQHLGFWIAEVRDAVSVGCVPDWGGGLWSGEVGETCGLVIRKAYDQRGEAAEYSRTWFDGERVCYVARLG